MKTRGLNPFRSCIVAGVLALPGLAWSETRLALPQEEPRFGFSARSNAFSGQVFDQPINIISSTGDETVYVIERRGRIIALSSGDSYAPRTIVDLGELGAIQGSGEMIAAAARRSEASMEEFFVLYTTESTQSLEPGLRLQVSRLTPDVGAGESSSVWLESPILSQPMSGGQAFGGDLEFGLDGYLYIALGADAEANAVARLDGDFFSGILRIDVDKRPESLEPNPHSAMVGDYGIPPDNPFLGATEFRGSPVDAAKLRTEFWAVGFRAPRGLYFDVESGSVYCGDSGEDFEEINLVVAGGDYGLGRTEGYPTESEAESEFVAPLHAYAHGSGRQMGRGVVGGVIYRGTAIPQLSGLYLFADRVEGNIWGVFPGANQGPTPSLWFAATEPFGIAGIGTDPRSGDILFADPTTGWIRRLEFESGSGASLPQKLSETGAFQDLETLTPVEGVVPYEINLPFWSDNAMKRRWFAPPLDSAAYGFRAETPWDLPSGAVWIKHFDIEMVVGDSASKRRLETRFLVRNVDGVYGVTYRWNAEQSEAFLVPESGEIEDITILEDGVERIQRWTYPSRRACLVCHTKVGGYALGFNTGQLNREMETDVGSVNQLEALANAGHLQGFSRNPIELPRYSRPDETSHSVTHRVRSYLAATCSQCHQPGGPAVGIWDARASTPTFLAGIVKGNLERGTGVPQDRVVVPGSLEHSQLYQRLAHRDQGSMPPLATSIVDPVGVQLLEEWILSTLPGLNIPDQGYDEWARARIGYDVAINSVDADPDGDGLRNGDEYLLDTDPLIGGEGIELYVTKSGSNVSLRGSPAPDRDFSFELDWRESFHAPWRSTPRDHWRLVRDQGSVWIESIVEPNGIQERYWRLRTQRP